MDRLAELNQILESMYPRYGSTAERHAVIAFIGSEEGFLRRVKTRPADEQTALLEILSAYFIETKPALFKGKTILSIDLGEITWERLSEKEASVLSVLFMMLMEKAQKQLERSEVIEIGKLHLKYLDRVGDTIKDPWMEWLVEVRKEYTYEKMMVMYKLTKDFDNAIKCGRAALRYVSCIRDKAEEDRRRVGIYDYMSAAYGGKGDSARYLEYKCLQLATIRKIPTEVTLRDIATEHDFMAWHIFRREVPDKRYIERYWMRINAYLEKCSKSGTPVSLEVLEQFELFSALMKGPLEANLILKLKALDGYLRRFERIKSNARPSEADVKMLRDLEFICRPLRDACKKDGFGKDSKKLACELFFMGSCPTDFNKEFERLLAGWAAEAAGMPKN